MDDKALVILTRIETLQIEHGKKLDKVEETQEIIVNRLSVVEKRQLAGRVALGVVSGIIIFLAWLIDHTGQLREIAKHWLYD